MLYITILKIIILLSNATWGMLTATTYPLSEAGYYVFPVAVVNETFKQNGLTNAADIHNIKLDKLHSIFNNDAVLYITVKDYGTRYQLIQSVTTVEATAKLVDAKNGKELWYGTAIASDAGQKNNNGGLIGALVGAIVDQVAGTLLDKGYDIAQLAGAQLLSPTKPNGILYGPRSPKYKTEINK
ncbi:MULTISPECIES: DUF799 domain-containing protein [unclassified Avibacterium]|uniref:DUF799 domain-containing protein n=1 Tax=unclassified Avibacterium TaxID=2685287 RepID=UPI0020275D8C|nr:MULTISPECIES: GNA1162 family protein [unclassified Avibacterium]MCW9697924.1 DUF799 domain-containing protein [Avibacterium sp. 20-129]URL05745.1 DUF799 domain-containing protein [Avibacterium sp. 21-595]